MSDRRPSRGVRIAVFIAAGIAVLLAVAGLVLVEVGGGDIGTADATGAAILAVSFVLVGAVVTAARGNAVGWVMLISGSFNAVNACVGDYSTIALQHDLPLRAASAWLATWVWVGGAVGFPLVLLLFPTGRPPSRSWWIVGISAVVCALSIGAGNAIAAWPYVSLPMDGSRLAESVPDGGAMRIVDVMLPVFAATLLSAAVSLIFRYRRANTIERQQIKWLLFAGVALTFTLFTMSPAAPIDLVERFPVLNSFAPLALTAIPTAIGVAILRYHLYDIDVVINRALVYTVLTAILAGAYTALVIALQTVLAPITAESDLAVAGSTLVVAALFGPVRARVQRFIDRRFYQRKVDAQRTIETFTGGLQDEVDLLSLSSRLVRTIQETMQPTHVSIWLKGGPRAGFRNDSGTVGAYKEST